MRSEFSYREAAELFGSDCGLSALIDRVSASGVPVLCGLELLAAHTEISVAGERLILDLPRRLAGLRRIDRTRLLVAAHSVIVTTAFFQALGEMSLPVNVDKLRLTKSDQALILLAERMGPTANQNLLDILSSRPVTPRADMRADALFGYWESQYSVYEVCLRQFLRSLAAWERLSELRKAKFTEEASEKLPRRARARYQRLYKDLARGCPEFSVWSTADESPVVRSSLGGLRATLTTMTSGESPDSRREGLARTYDAALDRPLVETGDLPRDLVVPRLREAYVASLYKVQRVAKDDDISLDSWWCDVPLRGDIQDYLAGYFTSAQAVVAPLVVLGQPGSGKSVLTKMLAALLPPSDFLPVRVVLRDVKAEADLQEQIEYAIKDATGERLEWVELARSAGKAVPVVMLDGFDELLQATGVSRSDYLMKIRDFQRRELDQGRAVVVVVTSRTAVANRARLPADTMALRLEPFGDAQITSWLEVWNKANAEYFGKKKIQELEPARVLRNKAHRALAGQPLLLFMLALFDLDGNALGSSEKQELGRAELYEALLRRFARREVVKTGAHLPDDAIDRQVEQELVRLSVVAFAMFNRGAQWVTEDDLNQDLGGLFGDKTTHAEADMRARLTAAQLVLGRFFFVHQAFATRDDTTLHTYEFLHATFGEYLVARFVHRVLVKMVQEDLVSSGALLGASDTNDGLLHALLSFSPLTTRGAVLGFFSELATDFGGHTPRELLVRLLAAAQYPRSNASYPRYEPRPMTLCGRIAAYSVNLVLLLVVIEGQLRSEDVADWTGLTYLWRSQLNPEEWTSLVTTLGISRTGPGAHFLVGLDGMELGPDSLDWSLAGQLLPDGVHAVGESMFHGSSSQDVLTHALLPVVTSMNLAVSSTTSVDDGLASPAHLLLRAWTAAERDLDKRTAAYRACLSAGRVERLYWVLLLEMASRDQDVPSEVLRDLLEKGVSEGVPVGSLLDIALLLLQRNEYELVAFGAIDQVLADWDESLALPATRTLARLIELGLEREARTKVRRFVNAVAFLNAQVDLAEIAEADRGLYRRLELAMESIGLAQNVRWPA
ncbi:NACHT domain-containing protein [Lentzea kentuckyensis]|uniref:NACHT domain-containing protein n=1 Tax=Lentzea kentuckyensis TaxID=360086 RepID=UPI000A36766B|nr:hypothetical protein [Lentzea kentuckyensis]